MQCANRYPPEWKIGCHDPSIAAAFVDHLQLIRLALSERGVDYRVAAVSENLDLGKITVPGLPLPGLPFMINGADAVLIVVDRDVNLTRSDVAVSNVALCANSSWDGCHYRTLASVDALVVMIPVKRSFSAIDANVNDRVYRIINTHLEVKN